MFKVLEPGARTRRVWSAGTVTLSVAAHVLVLAGATYASLHASPPPPLSDDGILDTWEVPPTPTVKPDPQPTQPERQDETPAPRGHTVELPAPTDVPDHLPPVNIHEEPLHSYEVTGQGPLGVKYGDPLPNQQSGGNPNATGDGPQTVDVSDLAEIPSLENTGEVQRVLQRNYPPMLRDAGVTGEARLQFVINTDGRVDASTVQVVGATNEAFGDAARRAVEHFRFKPASMMGEPVRVLITIPIRFTLQPR
jgi:protein TonB